MQVVSVGQREMRISMPATLENIDEADNQLCDFLTAAGAAIDLFAIRIIFHEAMMNAVIHGSGQDPSMTVYVNAELTDAGLRLSIRDEGPGFPWQDVHGDIDTAVDSGRGLPLLEIYSSQVEFNPAGNQVTMFRGYTPQAEANCTPAGGTL